MNVRAIFQQILSTEPVSFEGVPNRDVLSDHVLPGDAWGGRPLDEAALAWSDERDTTFLVLRRLSSRLAAVGLLRFDEDGFGTMRIELSPRLRLSRNMVTSPSQSAAAHSRVLTVAKSFWRTL